ncbi:hypothetical protein DL768_003125 [Monosporascus sp. mg162]|nr:hypothetical protein DL768_003125 [Monosporascus sp. mg162]
MVVGGRFALVGVDLALGARFSYFTNTLGLAVDNVAGQRVVLANGTVVVASAEAHQDLHWALNGGYDNFGVVTHFILETVPHPGLYGGRFTSPQSSLDAIYDWASNTTYGYSPLAYLKNATALPASLQPWLDIEHPNSTIKGPYIWQLGRRARRRFPGRACAIEKVSGNNPLGLKRARPETSLTVVGLGLQFKNEQDIDEVLPAWDIFIRDPQLERNRRTTCSRPYGNQQAIASYGDASVDRLQEVSTA